MPQVPAADVKSWREIYPVHPCADVFPMMSEAELTELAKDIQTHGLQQPVRLYYDAGQKRAFVLDGRNRLDALVRLGVTIPTERTFGGTVLLGTHNITIFQDLWTVTDPAAFVIGANIRRRHLTKEQQAELILKTIEAGRVRNDRAKVARSFSPTVGQRGGSTKDHVLEQAVTEGAKHGIAKRTIQRARATAVRGKTASPRPPSTSPARQTPATPAVVKAEDRSQRYLKAAQSLLLRYNHIIPKLEEAYAAAAPSLLGIAHSTDASVREKSEQCDRRLAEARTLIEQTANCLQKGEPLGKVTIAMPSAGGRSR